MTEECEHKFNVDRIFDGVPIAQFLTCKKCGLQFFGYDGDVGNPLVIHLMRKPIHEKQFLETMYTNVDLR